MIAEQRLKKIFCCVVVAGIATVLIQINAQSVSTDKIIQTQKTVNTLNLTELTGMLKQKKNSIKNLELKSTVAWRTEHLKKTCSELEEKGAKFALSDYVKGGF